MVKSVFKRIFYKLGYELSSVIQNKKSDDPIEIVQILLGKENVRLIIDGGASIGDTSNAFSRYFPSASIHAFEPFPKFFSVLQQKSDCNNRIISYPYALSNTEGNEFLRINKSEGTNSLLKSSVNQNHPHAQFLETMQTTQVVTKKLDILFPNETVDILKLDLQGGEYNALIGAQEMLSQGRIRLIISEVIFDELYKEQKHASELIMLLESHGFKIFNFYQNHYHHGELLQSDIVFYHNSISSDVDRLKKENFLPFSKYLER